MYLYESKTLNMWFFPRSQTSDRNTHTNFLEVRKYLVELKRILGQEFPKSFSRTSIPLDILPQFTTEIIPKI